MSENGGGFGNFDRFCTERGVTAGDEPAAFADWLAQTTGTGIVGGPVGESVEVVAVPDDVPQ